MSALDRVSLKAKFETGDTPQGSDYSDMIDSAANLAETAAQTFLGPISFAGGVSGASVAGGTGSFSGTVSAATFHGNVNAATINTGSLSAQTITTSGLSGPAGGVNINTNLSFSAGIIKETVASVACLGTTQASGTLIVSTVNILRTVSTGAADSVTMPGFYPGAQYILINHTTGSARIFPPSGGAIDGLSTNAELSLGPRGSAIGRAVIWCETSTQAHSIRGG